MSVCECVVLVKSKRLCKAGAKDEEAPPGLSPSHECVSL